MVLNAAEVKEQEGGTRTVGVGGGRGAVAVNLWGESGGRASAWSGRMCISKLALSRYHMGMPYSLRLFYTRWVSPAAQCRREWERKGVVMDRWWLNLLLIPTRRAPSEAGLVGVVEPSSLLWDFRDPLGHVPAVSCVSAVRAVSSRVKSGVWIQPSRLRHSPGTLSSPALPRGP